jgi:hypothetical protein
MRGFKPYLRAVLFLLLWFAISRFLDFGLIPWNYAESDIKRITTATYDDLFIGTSHGANNISPAAVDQETGRKSTNICLPREFPVDSYYLIKLACETGHKPDRVIYELDPTYWTLLEPQDANSYYIYRSFPLCLSKLLYFKGKTMHLDWRFTLSPWRDYTDRFKDFFQLIRQKTTMDHETFQRVHLDDKNDRLTEDGQIAKTITEGMKRGGYEEVIPFSPDRVQAGSLKWFLNIVSFCKKEGIEFTVIRTPVPKETREHFAENYAAADEYFTQLFGSYGISLIDFSKVPDPELEKSEHYVDADGHMDETLAAYFSTVLGKYLKKQ